MELKDTVELMLSEDLGDRLVAEYYQLCYRIERLEPYIDTLEQSYKKTLMRRQLQAMYDYRMALEARLQLEQMPHIHITNTSPYTL